MRNGKSLEMLVVLAPVVFCILKIEEIVPVILIKGLFIAVIGCMVRDQSPHWSVNLMSVTAKMDKALMC